ncbi:hypothetical protein AB4090_04845 [Acidithiobacillus sp. IBUN Pt1247-S3]|uniref:hypothetical protein n=1 Tax=Acidithiobacillus sp. IBUN Pt1247-S3 TaxID=3166642 RepID=UPI0034E4478B
MAGGPGSQAQNADRKILEGSALFGDQQQDAETLVNKIAEFFPFLAVNGTQGVVADEPVRLDPPNRIPLRKGAHEKLVQRSGDWLQNDRADMGVRRIFHQFSSLMGGEMSLFILM